MNKDVTQWNFNKSWVTVCATSDVTKEFVTSLLSSEIFCNFERSYIISRATTLVLNSKSDPEVKVVEKFSFHLSGIPVFQKTERRYHDHNMGYTSWISLKFY